MLCCEISMGTGDCSYAIYLPYKLSTGENKCVAIDKCLLPEIITLWELGIKTTGNCYGHGVAEAYIGVWPEYIEKMKQLGYQVYRNKCDLTREDSFTPKTILKYGESKNNGEWR